MSIDQDFLSFEQLPFGSDSFADNPEPRCACMLILDSSSSMHGEPVTALNNGIKLLKEELLSDPLAAKRVEVSVVTFGPVSVESEFRTAPNFNPPFLRADGMTPLGEAVEKGIAMVSARKQVYKDQGIGYYRPWIILITDGAPTDSWTEAAKQVKKGEDDKAFAFFAIGVEGADLNTLSKISVRAPLKLQGLKFRELFQWLSASMRSVSSKDPSSSINLLPPSGWANL